MFEYSLTIMRGGSGAAAVTSEKDLFRTRFFMVRMLLMCLAVMLIPKKFTNSTTRAERSTLAFNAPR